MSSGRCEVNDRERDLVPYYNKTLEYYSPIGIEALALFKIEWANVSSVLDLGCGDGRLLGYVASHVEYLGLDGSPGRIAVAKEDWPRWPSESFRVHDLYDPLPNEPGGWSLVCLFEVLEHLAKPLSVLAAANNALHPDGRVIGSVPIADGPSERHLQVFATTADAIKRLEPTWWTPFGRHLMMEWTT